MASSNSSLAKRMAQMSEDSPDEPLRIKPARKENRPKTGPGQALNWALDQARIEQLERHQAGSPIALDRIDPNPYQPRLEFDPIALDELATSIRTKNLIQPISVRVHPDNPERYQIIVGERRVRAFQSLGREEIPAIVSEMDDETMALVALSENLDREDLSDFEISQSIIRMRDTFPKATALADKVGISRKQLYRYFAYENLPKFILEDLRETPSLLGASAVDELAGVLKEYEDPEHNALKELWARFKEGQFQQGKLASKLKSALTHSSAGASRRSLELFSRGKKIGFFRCDSTGLKLNIKGAALSEDMEKRIGDLLEELFPDSPSKRKAVDPVQPASPAPLTDQPEG